MANGTHSSCAHLAIAIDRIKGRAMNNRLKPAIAATLAALAGAHAALADPADFYRGKTVEILVGFSPGGGYDTYARALARSLGSQIPGNPQVVVRNFTGAGSLRLARYLQDAVQRDALSFGTIDNGLLTASVLKEGIQFNASKLSWI